MLDNFSVQIEGLLRSDTVPVPRTSFASGSGRLPVPQPMEQELGRVIVLFDDLQHFAWIVLEFATVKEEEYGQWRRLD